MTIIIGTILTQPQLQGSLLLFRLKIGNRILTVIRTAQEDQKLDILFLCPGLQIALWGRGNDSFIIADKIRILRCSERNY